MNEAVIQLKNLSKYFTVETNFWGKPTSVLKAVDNFTLDIFRGEAFGLVGESGCGKSTVGKMHFTDKQIGKSEQERCGTD
ncbi:MAG: ATP-binding cassette domain-containing protein, partial [Peptococcaceae bacterium]|nr:ATP-binding cassette domain-containing protein [Peptococcaceae bacterium]